MPHHFTKNTTQAEAYCPTCNKNTPHAVFDGRLGRCMNDHPHPIQAARKAEPTPQLELFK
jgi:hypothetical protein